MADDDKGIVLRFPLERVVNTILYASVGLVLAYFGQMVQRNADGLADARVQLVTLEYRVGAQERQLAALNANLERFLERELNRANNPGRITP